MKFITIKKSVLIMFLSIIALIISLIFFLIYKNKKDIPYNINFTEEINNSDVDEKNKINEDINSYYLEQYKNKKLVALTFDDGPSEYNI